MLESFAVGLLNSGEGELSALGLLLIVAGFFVGVLFPRGKTLSLRRVPYFIWLAVVYGIVSALPIAWLLTFDAARNGVLSMLVSLVFGGIFGAGVASGVLAHARSINAYGEGGSAWMGIVPFANLVLLFKRPLDWNKGTWGNFGINCVGVVFGLLLMGFGAAIGKDVEREIAAIANHAQSDPVAQQAGIEMMLQVQGLEATLSQMAAGVPSQKVDETTTLLRVEGTGTTLRYVYEVSMDLSAIPASMRMGLIKNNCTYEVIRPVIEAGATVEHVYQRKDGTEIGTVTVTRQVCGY